MYNNPSFIYNISFDFDNNDLEELILIYNIPIFIMILFEYHIQTKSNNMKPPQIYCNFLNPCFELVLITISEVRKIVLMSGSNVTLGVEPD